MQPDYSSSGEQKSLEQNWIKMENFGLYIKVEFLLQKS